MSSRPSLDPYGGRNPLIDRMIGDVYPTVRYVAEHLPYMIFLAQNFTDLRPRDVTFRSDPDSQQIQWQYVGDTEWKSLLPFSDINGKSVELDQVGDNISWRYSGDQDWIPLISVEALKGAPGNDGREVTMRQNGNYIEWTYLGTQGWNPVFDASTLLTEVQETSDTLNARMDQISDAQKTDKISATGWTTGPVPLSTKVGTYNGQGGEISSADTGTHTDPISSTVVPNAGLYTWVAASNAWTKTADDFLSQKADKTAVAALIRPEVSSAEEVAAAIVFEDRSRTYVEIDYEGKPTEYSRDILAEALGDRIADFTSEKIGYRLRDMEDNNLSYAIVFSDGSVAFALDKNGEPAYTREKTFRGPHVAYGDSTTEGADIVNPQNFRWSRLLEGYLGQTIYNYGVSGETAEEISFRQSSLQIAATVVSGQIAATGNTVITFDSVNPLRARTDAIHQVIALTEDNQQIPGTIRRSGSNNVFTRASDGIAINSGKIQLISIAGRVNRDKLAFIGKGVNNEEDIVNGVISVDVIKEMYARDVSNLKPGTPYVLWGMLDRGLAEAAGTPRGNIIREVERYLSLQFGASFCPVRKFLASPYALTVAVRLKPDFAPTPADAAAITGGTVPPSYRASADSVHLNYLGHALQAWFMYQHLIQRGLV